MRYAILQTTLEIPPVEKLQRAFRALPTLTDYDAHILARDAFGVLVKNLSDESAGVLQGALRIEGIETQIVAETQLPALPEQRHVRRLECRPEALILHDAIGRPFQVEWRHLLLITAGEIPVSVTRREERETTVRRWRAGVAGMRYVEEPTREVRHKHEQQNHLLIELVLQRAVLRYSINASESASLLFQYLGERRSQSLEENLSLLVRDLATYAPHALLTQGASLLCAAEPALFGYPSKSAFYEEITWFLWRTGHPG